MKTGLLLLRAELGSQVGVSSQTINVYETGHYESSLLSALKIVGPLFEKKVAGVFPLDSPQPRPTAFQELGRTR